MFSWAVSSPISWRSETTHCCSLTPPASAASTAAPVDRCPPKDRHARSPTAVRRASAAISLRRPLRSTRARATSWRRRSRAIARTILAPPPSTSMCRPSSAASVTSVRRTRGEDRPQAIRRMPRKGTSKRLPGQRILSRIESPCVSCCQGFARHTREDDTIAKDSVGLIYGYIVAPYTCEPPG